MIDEQEIAKRMKKVLKKDDSKQDIVAKAMGISQPHLNEILNGKASPTIKQLNRFEEVTGENAEKIITGKEMVQNNESKDSSQQINLQFITLSIQTDKSVQEVDVEKLKEQVKKGLEGLTGLGK